MKVNKSLIAIFASALALGSCTDFLNDFDAKQAQYKQGFEEVFGEIDPNQDWSMVKQVNINANGVQDGMLEVYDKDPLGNNAHILGRQRVENGAASFNFDMPENLDQVFVRVKKGDNGYYPVKGYYSVVDNKVNIGATTRAIVNGLDDSTIPTGDATRISQGTAKTFTSKMLDFTKRTDVSVVKDPNYDGDLTYIDGYWAVGGDATFRVDINGSGKDMFTDQDITNLIPLYGVVNESDARPHWYVSDVAQFFIDVDGQKAVFKESENHMGYMREGSVPHFNKNVVFTMASEGPVVLDYFAKGTEYDNEFGYFYYTDDDLVDGELPTEKFKTMNKYILCDNISNMKSDAAEKPEGAQDGRRTGKVEVAENEQIPWNLLYIKYPAGSTTGVDGLSYAESNYDAQIYGTRLQLVYFGEDGTGTPSYSFPEGTKIGLFIWGRTDNNRNTVVTSISKLNQDMYNEPAHAITFKYNDQIVYAMEDMRLGGDRDINDMMFIIDGDFEEEIPEIITPTTPDYPTWVVACEDLGGDFDYDFNDVVFGLRLTETSEDGKIGKLELIPFAAGGKNNDVIYYDGNKIGEIHKLLDSESDDSQTEYARINATPGQKPDAGTAVLLAENVSMSISINSIKEKLAIVSKQDDGEGNYSDNTDGTYITANIGKQENKAPQIIILPPGWNWPSEQTLISDIYPNFKDWSASKSVTDWCNTMAEGATDFVYNPYHSNSTSVTPVTPEEGGETGGNSGSGSATQKFDIKLVGSSTIARGGTNEYTVSVTGYEDLSELTLSTGVYSSAQMGTYLTVTGVENGKFKVTVNTDAVIGTELRFYVKVAADETHIATRAEFTVKVVGKTPEFTVSTEVLDLLVGEKKEFTITTSQEKCDGNAITFSIDDSSIASLVSGAHGINSDKTVTGVSEGVTTIKVTHAATDIYSELTKTITVNVTKPTYGEEVAYTSLGNNMYEVNINDLKSVISDENSNVTFVVVGDKNKYYSAFSYVQCYTNDPWGGISWVTIGSEGEEGATSRSWNLTAAQYQQVVASTENVIKLSWAGIDNAKLYVKATPSSAKRRSTSKTIRRK